MNERRFVAVLVVVVFMGDTGMLGEGGLVVVVVEGMGDVMDAGEFGLVVGKLALALTRGDTALGGGGAGTGRAREGCSRVVVVGEISADEVVEKYALVGVVTVAVLAVETLVWSGGQGILSSKLFLLVIGLGLRLLKLPIGLANPLLRVLAVAGATTAM